MCVFVSQCQWFSSSAFAVSDFRLDAAVVVVVVVVVVFVVTTELRLLEIP